MQFGDNKIKYKIESILEKPEQKEEGFFDFLKDLVIIAIIVIIIRTFIAMPFQISGYSMSDSYYDKEFIIVDRISYFLGDPKRGDVIVFKPKTNKEKEYFLKRIVGVPGDIVKIENGDVYIKPKASTDFTKLDEQYLNTENKGATFIGYKRTGTHQYTLEDDQYFVMGDNRNHSTDSRECFGNCLIRKEFISKEDMTGKLFIDLGYFNLKELKFLHPEKGINTKPRLLASPKTYTYPELEE